VVLVRDTPMEAYVSPPKRLYTRRSLTAAVIILKRQNYAVTQFPQFHNSIVFGAER
jgi:hypothetical protein